VSECSAMFAEIIVSATQTSDIVGTSQLDYTQNRSHHLGHNRVQYRGNHKPGNWIGQDHCRDDEQEPRLGRQIVKVRPHGIL